MKYILLSVIAVLILLTFSKKETEMMPLSTEDTILTFGDSLTFGYGAKTDESYPTLLAKYTGLRVINAGVNGDTSEAGLRRLGASLKDPSIKLTILFMGGNDIILKRSMQDLKENLRSMIKMAKEKQIDVLLISVPNVTLFGLSPIDLYEELSKEEDVPLLSAMLADILSDPSLKIDQIHPNAKGYEKMAQEIFKSLKRDTQNVKVSEEGYYCMFCMGCAEERRKEEAKASSR
ncbi:MAG: arylesterase [Sulfurovum sp.]|nr:arylesterase [Sulfurovum sp.]